MMPIRQYDFKFTPTSNSISSENSPTVKIENDTSANPRLSTSQQLNMLPTFNMMSSPYISPRAETGSSLQYSHMHSLPKPPLLGSNTQNQPSPFLIQNTINNGYINSTLYENSPANSLNFITGDELIHRNHNPNGEANPNNCSDLYLTCLDSFREDSVKLKAETGTAIDYSSLPLPSIEDEEQCGPNINHFKSEPCISGEKEDKQLGKREETPMEGIKEATGLKSDDKTKECSNPWDLVVAMQNEITSLQKENSSLRLELYQSKLFCSELMGQMNSKNHWHEPGYVADVIAELHAANKVRDQAMIARLKLANQERDSILRSYSKNSKPKCTNINSQDSTRTPLSSKSDPLEPFLMRYSPRLSTSLPPHIFAETSSTSASLPPNKPPHPDFIPSYKTHPGSQFDSPRLPTTKSSLPPNVPFFCVGAPKVSTSDSSSVLHSNCSDSLKGAFELYSKQKSILSSNGSEVGVQEGDKLNSSVHEQEADYSNNQSIKKQERSFSTDLDLPSRNHFIENVNQMQSCSTPFTRKSQPSAVARPSLRPQAIKQPVEILNTDAATKDTVQGKAEDSDLPIESEKDLQSYNPDGDKIHQDVEGVEESSKELSENGDASMNKTTEGQVLPQQNTPAPCEGLHRKRLDTGTMLDKLRSALCRLEEQYDSDFNCINEEGDLVFDEKKQRVSDSEDSKDCVDIGEAASLISSEASSLFCWKKEDGFEGTETDGKIPDIQTNDRVEKSNHKVSVKQLAPTKPPRSARLRSASLDDLKDVGGCEPPDKVHDSLSSLHDVKDKERVSGDSVLKLQMNSKDRGSQVSFSSSNCMSQSSLSPERIIMEMTECGGGGVMIANGGINVCDSNGNSQSIDDRSDVSVGDGKENIDINRIDTNTESTPKLQKKKKRQSSFLSAIANLRGRKQGNGKQSVESDDSYILGGQSEVSPKDDHLVTEGLVSTLSLHKAAKKKRRKSTKKEHPARNYDTSNTSEDYKPHVGFEGSNQFKRSPYLSQPITDYISSVPKPLSGDPNNTFQFNTSGLLNSPPQHIFPYNGVRLPNYTNNQILVRNDTFDNLLRPQLSVLPLNSAMFQSNVDMRSNNAAKPNNIHCSTPNFLNFVPYSNGTPYSSNNSKHTNICNVTNLPNCLPQMPLSRDGLPSSTSYPFASSPNLPPTKVSEPPITPSYFSKIVADCDRLSLDEGTEV